MDETRALIRIFLNQAMGFIPLAFFGEVQRVNMIAKHFLTQICKAETERPYLVTPCGVSASSVARSP